MNRPKHSQRTVSTDLSASTEDSWAFMSSPGRRRAWAGRSPRGCVPPGIPVSGSTHPGRRSRHRPRAGRLAPCPGLVVPNRALRALLAGDGDRAARSVRVFGRTNRSRVGTSRGAATDAGIAPPSRRGRCDRTARQGRSPGHDGGGHDASQSLPTPSTPNPPAPDRTTTPAEPELPRLRRLGARACAASRTRSRRPRAIGRHHDVALMPP